MKRRFEFGILSARFADGIPLLRRLLRAVALAIAISGSLMLVVGAMLFVLAQTAIVNRWLAVLLQSLLRDQLQAELSIGSVEVRLLSGVRLDRVAIAVGGDTVLVAPHIDVHYTPEALIFRTIAARVVLDSPRVTLVRYRDSSWNIERILKPSASPSGEPPPLLLYIRSLQIRNATIVTTDSLTAPTPDQRFNPLHARLEEVQLSATVVAHLRQRTYSIALDQFAWSDRSSGLQLVNARGVVHADTTSVRTPVLVLELPHSRLQIEQAHLDIGSDSIAYRAQIAMHLDTGDSRHVAPPPVRLGRAISLSAHISGTHRRLMITDARLSTGETRLHGYAELDDLSAEGPSRWHATVEHSRLGWSDVLAVMPWLELPRLPVLETCTIERLDARGTADSVAAQVRATTPAASVDFLAQIHTAKVFRYDLRGSIRNANLAAIDTALPATIINATVELSGKGTALPDAQIAARVRLDSSRIARIPIAHTAIALRVEEEMLRLDTLDVHLETTTEPARVGARGSVALSWPYAVGLVLESEHLPLSALFGSHQLPQLLTAQIDYRSQGMQLDSLRARLRADIAELVFQDRAVFPFHLDALLDFDESGRRLLAVASPQIEARIVGRYTLAGLGRVVSDHLALADTLIRRMVASASGETTAAIAPITARDTLEIEFSARVRSLALLSPLLAPTVLEANGMIAGTLSSHGNRTAFALDTIAVGQLIFSTQDGLYLASMPIEGALRVGFSHLDTKPNVEYASIRFAVDSVLRVGQLRVVRPAVGWNWDGRHLRIATDTAWLENTMPLQLEATITPLSGDQYTVVVEHAHVGLSSDFAWTLAAPLRMELKDGRYTIESLMLRHQQSSALFDASGTLSPAGADQLHFAVRNFDLAELSAIPSLQSLELVRQLGGRADSVVVELNGKWARPQFSIASSIRNLAYGDIVIGNQVATLNYDGSHLRGAATVLVPADTPASQVALDIRIRSLPLDCGLLPLQLAIRQNEPVAITVEANDISLATIEPFFPALSQVRGQARAVLEVSGSLPKSIRFRGSASYEDCEFLVPATNIRYRSRGVLRLADNVLRLDTIELFNDPADLVGGMAQISGAVTFDGFQPDELDISVRIPGERGLLVMSNATAAVNSAMYGRLVISTQEDNRMRRLHLSGRVEQPRLGGFLRIEEADITFPPTTSINVQTASFVYHKTGEGYVITDAVAVARPQDTAIGDLPPRHGMPSPTTRLSITPGFNERLYTAVDVKIRRQMRIKMDFSSVEQLVAFVEQENRNDYLRFIREGTRRTELRGTLIVDPSSTYKFYSTFAAGGRLRFTTGAIDNPEVDLQAVYTGERIIGSDNRRETYRVILFITGTKRQPRLRMTYEINGETAPGARGDSVRIMTNALLLVLFGRTQEELTTGSNGSMATSALDQSVNAARSAAISAFLTNALQGGVIKNVNIDFGSSDVTSLSQARIMLTGQLFGANVTVGGSVADLAQNSQITLDLSVGNTLGIEWLRNLVAQFQATANPGQSLSRQQKQWEFRLGWRVP